MIGLRWLAIGIVLMATRAVAMDTPLQQADSQLVGEDSSDEAGVPVARGGDINGDGLGDFLVGAYMDDAGDIQAGQAYVIFGQPTGLPASFPLATADASFIGEGLNEFAGCALAGVGDANGDGYDDVLIGAYKSSEADTQAGQAYLITGREFGWTLDFELEYAPISFLGEDAGDWAGYSVAGAGDVDGDGLTDLLIGALGNEEVGPMAGQTYLVLGRETGWASATDLGSADGSFLGEAGDDQSAYAMAGAGDVNGDGLADFMIGAPENGEAEHQAGQVYLLLGGTSPWGMDTDLGNADASFLGEESSARAGNALAGAGDVNGDGLDDLVIGAAESGEGGSLAGQVYLVMGRTAGWAMDTDLGDADASFLGEAVGDGAGCAVAGAGDVDGDGLADLLIGASGNGEAGNDTGQTYLIYGHATGWVMDVILDSASESFLGEASQNYSGAAVAFIGDLDGNGLDEVLIGAPGANDMGENSGKAYVMACFDADGDGWQTCDGDCADDVATAHPGGTEVCDGADSDCDGQLPADEEDSDGDGWLPCNGDCDDLDATIFPGAPELCDGLDNDCDGETDEGTDRDDDGDGATECDGDCDDTDPDVYAGADEICDDLDNDCNDITDDVDQDADGFVDASCDGDDCDDTDADVHPEALEVCDDGQDNDCDELTDDADPDCDTGDDDTAGDDDTGDDDSAADDDTAMPDDDVGDDDSAGEEPGGCGCRVTDRGPAQRLGCWIMIAVALWIRRATRRR